MLNAEEYMSHLTSNLNMNRQENILVLPMNTLRIVDVILQLEINKALNKLEPFDCTLIKTIFRIEKDLGKLNNIDSDTVYGYMKDYIVSYYEKAPRTYFYYMLETLAKQKFINNITVLFDDTKLHDDYIYFNNKYYDGSIESLKKYIESNGVTALVISDMEILKDLHNAGLNLDYMSVFVSEFSYNFIPNPGGRPFLKYITELKEDCPMLEICSINLLGVSYPKNLINKYLRCRKDDNNEST